MQQTKASKLSLVEKGILFSIWMTIGLVIAWMFINDNLVHDSLEELFWFGLSTSLYVYAAPFLNNRFLSIAWIIYCLGLLLDLLDEFISSEFLPLILIDTSLKNIGFILTCYCLVLMVTNKRKTIYLLNQEIENRKTLESKLLYEAMHDPLTGIGNRRACFEKFNTLCENNQMLLYFDLDNFKNANDEHGHNIGDKILIQFTHAMVKLYGEDVCFRIGGDEFVAFAPQAAIDTNEIRNLLLKDIAQYDVNVSIGFTNACTDKDPDLLLHDADALMYKDKKQKAVRSRSRN